MRNKTYNFFKHFVLFACITIVLQGCVATAMVGAAATGVMLISDRRDTSTIMKDQEIEFTAMTKLNKPGSATLKSHINVVSINQTVLMVGQTPSVDVKKQAEQIVSHIESVKRVFNELTVAPNISLEVRAKDSLITGKIKSKMVTNEVLDPNRVKVITENGIVYLLGLVTQPEAKIAVDIARNTNDVKQVVQLFEIVE